MRIPLVAAGVAAAAVLGPALGAREILARDLVALDGQVLSPRLLGLGHEPPRGVPSDAVVALLGQVLPTGVAVAWLCLACLVAAGCGVARIVRTLHPGPGRTIAAGAAAVAAVWNPWVAERLAIGQWPLLLGYAVLPWLVLRLTSGRPGPGLVGLVVVGSLGGAVSWMLLALVWLGCLSAVCLGRAPRRDGGGRRLGAVVIAGIALLGSAVPWAAPALLRPGGTVSDPAGFAVFAPRADLPVGTWLSILTGGGIWNGEVVPPGRDSLPGAVGALALLTLGVLGLVLAARRALADDHAARGMDGADTPADHGAHHADGGGAACGLILAGAAGLLLVIVTAWAPVRDLLATVPGGGLLRDSARLTAPWVLALSVGLGIVAARVVAGGMRWPAAGLALLPVAALPGAAWGAGGALVPTAGPDGVRAVAAAIDAEPTAGAVAVVPWAAYRPYEWNGTRPSVVPWSRLVQRRVVASGDLVVQTAGGAVTVAGEDPLADRVGDALAATEPSAALARAGVGLVLVDAPGPAGDPDPAADLASAVARDRGLSLVLERDGVRLYRLSGHAVAPVTGTDPPGAAVVGLDAAASVLLIGLAAVTRRSRKVASPPGTVG